MLGACYPFGVNVHVNMWLNEAIPYWFMGDKFVSTCQATMIN
jgi:hypothetical protein